VDFIVNVTVDENKKLTGVFAGDFDKAHRAGAEFCEQATSLQLDEPVDLVIISGGGYPLDKTFYQAAKPITVAWLILRKAARSLVLTECSEGLGSPAFVELLEMSESPKHLLELLAQPDFFKVDQWCAQTMAFMQGENEIAVHADGVAPEVLSRHGYEPAVDPQVWLDKTIAGLDPKAKIVVIPDGPYVYARTSEQ